MYDVRAGSPHTPSFEVRDGYGSLVESGVTGTMSVYGPASASVLTSGALVYQGAGRWGLTVLGADTVAIGTYRWDVPDLSFGSFSGSISGAFEAGVGGDLWLYREIYTAVRRTLDDGMDSVTDSAGSATTFKDTYWSYMIDQSLVGSEAFFFEPPTTSVPNPVRINDMTKSGGIVTFQVTKTWSPSTFGSGLDYWIGDMSGKGWRHANVVEAINMAIRRTMAYSETTDSTSLVVAMNQYEYNLPDRLSGITKLEYQHASQLDDRWFPIKKGLNWNYRESERKLLLEANLPFGTLLRATGPISPIVPGGMNSLVRVNGPYVHDEAVLHLLKHSPRQEDRQRALLELRTRIPTITFE